MGAIQWGRKETIIFPPHRPIYSYGALCLSLALTGLFVYLRFSFAQSALQQYYTPIYVRAAAGGVINKTDKYELLYVGDGRRMSPPGNRRRCTGRHHARAGRKGNSPGAIGGDQIARLPLSISRSAASIQRCPAARISKECRLQRQRPPGNLPARVWPRFTADAASVLRQKGHQAPQANEVRATAQRARAANAERVQPLRSAVRLLAAHPGAFDLAMSTTEQC